MTYIKKCPTVAASLLLVHSCFLSFFSRFFYACKMSWTTSRLEWFFFWHFCFHSSEETEKYPPPFHLQMICKAADARVKFGPKAISCQETKIGGENDPLKVRLKGVFFFQASFIAYVSHCCGASAASKQQHNQDLREMHKVGRILEFITFYQNASHFTRVLCATYYQNALRHEQLK